jgi:hypothetical protein
MASYGDDWAGGAGSGKIFLERGSGGGYALRRIVRGDIQGVGK